MSAPEKQFMFVHIPKTAGTTLALIFARQFRWNKILTFYPPKSRNDLKNMSAEYKNGFDLCFGHIPFTTEKSPSRGVEYYTFLRNPRERLLSGYRYIKGNKHQSRKIALNKANTLKDFIKEGKVKNMDNTMVRFLSGTVDKPFMEVDENDLKQALTNFDNHFTIFGLTEYFDESLVLLSDHMGWPQLYYVRENKSQYKLDKNEIDEEAEELIKKCNRFDEVIYRHARERFEKLLSTKKEVVERGLKELRTGNKKRKLILTLRSKASLFFSYLKIKIAKLFS